MKRASNGASRCRPKPNGAASRNVPTSLSSFCLNASGSASSCSSSSALSREKRSPSAVRLRRRASRLARVSPSNVSNLRRRMESAGGDTFSALAAALSDSERASVTAILNATESGAPLYASMGLPCVDRAPRMVLGVPPQSRDGIQQFALVTQAIS